MKGAKLIADKYIERFSVLCKTTTKIVLISLICVFVNWTFVVEPNFSKYKEINNDYKIALKGLNNRLIAVNQNYKGYSNDALKISKRIIIDKKDSIQNKNVSTRDSLLSIHDFPSLLKFVFFISDNRETGALLLNIFLVIIVTYTYFTRRICIKFISKALRIYKNEPTLQINKYQDFNLSSPYWLAPLPKYKNMDLDPLELRSILGWTNSFGFWNSMQTLTLFLILFIQTRLVYISFIMNGSKINAIFFLGSTITFFTLLIIFYWLLPFKIQDNFNHEAISNPVSRRDFIIVSSFSAILILHYTASPFLPKLLHIGFKRKPRFRNKRLKVNYKLSNAKNDILINRKTNVVFYVDSFGRSINFKSIATGDDFKRFGQNSAFFKTIRLLINNGTTPRFPLGNTSWHAENIALEYLTRDDFKTAVLILLSAIENTIQHFAISYRLHDLLALICIKHPDKVGVDTFDRLLEISNNAKDPVLKKRIIKWKDNIWVKKVLKEGSIKFNKRII